MGFLRRFGGQEHEPGDPYAHSEQLFERGKDAYHRQEFRKAAKAFESALRAAPDVPNSHFFLGACRIHQGDFAGALAPLQRCLELVPGHDDARHLLARALGRLERYDESEVHLARAAHQGNAEAIDMLARLKADYCRKCAAPVQYTQGEGPEDADITFVEPGIGWKCTNCGIVICGPCKRGYKDGPPISVNRCPDCGSRINPLMQ